METDRYRSLSIAPVATSPPAVGGKVTPHHTSGPPESADVRVTCDATCYDHTIFVAVELRGQDDTMQSVHFFEFDTTQR